MRLLDYINPIYAWLATINPDAPKAVFLAIVFSLVLLSRKVFPESWKSYSALIAKLVGITDDDTNWFKEFALKAGQAIPAALMGAALAGLGTGDFWATFKLSMFSFLAPIGHEFMAHYKGTLGKVKPPSSDDGKPVAKITSLRPLPRDLTDPPSAAFVGLALVLLACSGVPKNPQHPDPTCSDEAYTKLLGACSAEAAACVAKGGTEMDCGAVCDDEADAWQERCQ